jgi:hypothetical protein
VVAAVGRGFVVVAAEAADVGCSVTGLLFGAAVVLGLFVVLRVTEVDLTVVVVVLLGFVGLAVVFGLVLSSDSTENVVTSKSSTDSVVGSTLTIALFGVGFGRGAFVVSTKEIVVSNSGSGVVEVIEALIGVVFAAAAVVVAIGFLVVVAFLRDEIVVLRFTVRTVEATGFLVVFITVAVAFFDGFSVVVAGRRVAAADVRLSAGASGFLVVLATGFLVRTGSAVVLAVGGSGFRVVAFLCLESWIDWNVVSLLPSVVTSLKLIVVDTFR